MPLLLKKNVSALAAAPAPIVDETEALVNTNALKALTDSELAGVIDSETDAPPQPRATDADGGRTEADKPDADAGSDHETEGMEFEAPVTPEPVRISAELMAPAGAPAVTAEAAETERMLSLDEDMPDAESQPLTPAVPSPPARTQRWFSAPVVRSAATAKHATAKQLAPPTDAAGNQAERVDFASAVAGLKPTRSDSKPGEARSAKDVAAAEPLCRLLDLPTELLAAVVSQLVEDDELAASLACRTLRSAVAITERRAADARLSTRIGWALGSMGRLKWAVVSCGLPLSGRLLSLAARAGQLEQLSWLRARGCKWEPCGRGDDCCSSAAAGGHLAVLEWAHENDCPWDYRTCSKAAANGRLSAAVAG
jgi:hypothetical protein